ncbi:MAG: ATP-binding cassette domain-containing protein, partial [Anaerotignum sp.]|nr:ATP-binding cassette domain-containing protein [Anaerotignum sp.]
ELAARKACCEDFIIKLPKGYDTKVGDAGSLLSGGERQRIAIARAMIKDAPIIILDEATASIDSENEKNLGIAIHELTKGKTLITIAHRLSTIIDSEQIIVMEKGNKIAAGTHEQLLQACEAYKTMWSNHIGAEGWNMKGEANIC